MSAWQLLTMIGAISVSHPEARIPRITGRQGMIPKAQCAIHRNTINRAFRNTTDFEQLRYLTRLTSISSSVAIIRSLISFAFGDSGLADFSASII